MRILSALLATAVAVLGLLFWLDRGGEPGSSAAAPSGDRAIAPAPPRTDLERARPLAQERGSAPSARAAEGVPAPVRPAPLPEGEVAPVRIEARLVDQERRPIHGAWLRTPPGAVEGNGVDPESAPSDPEGRVALELALSAEEAEALQGSVELWAQGEGYANRTLSAQARPGETTWLGDVVLELGWGIRGTVVDGVGQPLADARIEAISSASSSSRLANGRPAARRVGALVRSGLDGRFELGGLPRRSLSLWGEADGYRGTLIEELLPPEGVVHGEEVLLQLVGRPLEESHAGFVLDAEGRPFAGAEVRLGLPDSDEFYDSIASATTDAEGHFRVWGVDPSLGAHWLEARDPQNDHDPSARLSLDPGRQDVELRLAPAAWGEVRVRGPEGEAVPWAWIETQAREWFSWREFPPTKADPQGNARLRLPQASFTLIVFGQGYQRVDTPTLGREAFVEPLEIVLPRGHALEGRVTAGGHPVVGAKVSLVSATDPKRRVFSMRATPDHAPFDVRFTSHSLASDETDGTGRFTMSPNWTGWSGLRVDAEGYGASLEGPFWYTHEEGRQGVELEVFPPGALEGAVLMPPGEEPTGIVVGISGGDGYALTQTVGPDGGFRFEGLAAGSYQIRRCLPNLPPRAELRAQFPGKVEAEPVVWDAEVRSGATTRLNLDLASQVVCRLTVRVPDVLDPGGPAIASLRMETAPETYAGFAIHAERQSSGPILLESTVPGRYRLVVELRDSAMRLQDVVELREGELVWEPQVEVGELELSEVEPTDPARRRFNLYHQWRGGGELEIWTYFGRPWKEPRLQAVPAGAGDIVRLISWRLWSPITPEEVMGVEVPAGGTARVHVE